MSISEVEGGAFNGLNNLKSLDLNYHAITKLVSGTFEGLSILPTLNLRWGSINEIEAGAFKGLSKLTYLSLDGCPIKQLVSGTFEGLNTLPSLGFISMDILGVEAGAFKGLDKLTYLSLTGNGLTKVVTGTFEGLNSLESLYLSYNEIVYLEENIFGANTKVPSYIDLNNNNLLFLPNSFFSATTLTPSYLDVGHNCLDCSLYSNLSYLASCDTQQSFDYCPKATNLCSTYEKFHYDYCFKCNSTGNDAFCDICMPGFKHTDNGCGCVKCEEGDQCEFGEPRNPDTPCGSCTSPSSSSASTCATCAVGYKYVNFECVACDENECCPGGRQGPSVYNCKQCSPNQATCVECIDGFNINKTCSECSKGYRSDGNKCTACDENECCPGGNQGVTAINCEQCSPDQTSCTKCVDGYTLNSECTVCSMGYAMENGKCTACNESECCPGGNQGVSAYNCKICSFNQESCMACNMGFDIQTNCLGCNIGYVYNNSECTFCGAHECCPGGMSTEPTYTNCLVCSSDMRACTQCIDGYEFRNGACTEKTSGGLMNHVHIGIIGIIVFIMSIIEMF